ncbi:putative dehydrogenase [Streptomyces ambofaciens ATCC 23877]|uniref:Putative dehydrogenase n=1 Tax=Streptomyces ambofaciens (strain ATCC 23877 / 3486 / DSM 40053 / JCM 4204 / NBRC 12836 / NRRL B-2516) TaxID=278992 RepID=A3KI83_STRA7|nr:putative dehydrogenase [Streptomyces ambofaciens ATCC 23877]CAJ89412.1 putative dehydrogenase [Streptomyces ambofaciens ATCC 23877]
MGTAATRFGRRLSQGAGLSGPLPGRPVPPHGRPVLLQVAERNRGHREHVEEAVAIRDRLLTSFDRAAILPRGPERRKLLTGPEATSAVAE